MTDLIFDNDDLLHLVLQHVVKEPRTFVAAGRVCKAWRAATMRDASLLMQAAGGCDFIDEAGADGAVCTLERGGEHAASDNTTKACGWGHVPIRSRDSRTCRNADRGRDGHAQVAAGQTRTGSGLHGGLVR